MKTVIIQKNNVNASPLTAFESIYNIPQLLTSSKEVGPWVYNENEVELPYSINAIDGHSGSYATGNNYTFTSTFTIHKLQPTYLWFTYATQSATIYVNGNAKPTHWGGYNSFFVDVTDNVKIGTNELQVIISNKNSNDGTLPISGDFNFNATLGKVKLLTAPVLPDTKYGYDGFHISSTVSNKTATITIKTSVDKPASVVCYINDDDFHFTERKYGKGEITFTATIKDPHLWHGTVDPHLYDITVEIYYNDELVHRLNRAYGLRYYEYVINDTTKVGDSEHPYTGFLLNGQKYLLRGVCKHHDIDGKANALSIEDIDNDFKIIKELGCNFIRLAHYPHPKQIYDYCDKLGIVVQTEIPWVNTAQSSLGTSRMNNVISQLYHMVTQHYNHTCIIFWGLANEIGPGTAANTATFLENCRSYIRTLDDSRLVGFVMSHGYNNPSSFGTPNLDWFGCNIYVGWYVDKTMNNPSNQLNTRKTNFITNNNKPFAFSEYGCGGNPECHSDSPSSTTTKGTNQPRHDIEYQMWLHEGHIAAIRNYPELLFTAMWVLFDFAVSSRQEGYNVCLDGETVTEDDSYKYLNNKGLVMRDHKTKKDTFYLYKAEWNPEKFVHICQKNYTKTASRVIKCYGNDGPTYKLYVQSGNNEPTLIETLSNVNDTIITFTAYTFTAGDKIIVEGETTSDSFYIATTHDYVTIGGIKWATMNIGASAITDRGLYFQWGDTAGYTSSQIGSGEGQKTFNFANYKYSNGGDSVFDMTKYSLTDGKLILDESDDAVKTYWGNEWRTPTVEDFKKLVECCTIAWTNNYNSTNTKGLVFTSKEDSNIKLFFPTTGFAKNTSISNTTQTYGYYWVNSIDPKNIYKGNYLLFDESTYRIYSDERVAGFPIRPVKDERTYDINVNFPSYTGGSKTYTKSESDEKYATIESLVDDEEAIALSLNDLNTRLNSIDTRLGNFTLVKVTQQQYDAIQTKDPNTLYIIND